MSSLIKLVLLYGGKSSEHEISLKSAASVLTNLDTSRYQVIPVGMDKEGQFYRNSYEELLSHKTSLPVRTEKSVLLPSLLENGHLAIEADVVFPVVHGPLYEDGSLQGLLELAGIAYVGCDVLSSAMGMDKDIARRVACVDGLEAARYRLLNWSADNAKVVQFCQQTVQALQFPLFVKPCSQGSSVGIHKVKTPEELMAAIDDARHYDNEILVEEYIQGREIELAVLENADNPDMPFVSGAGEIIVKHPDGFYSYNAKYLESSQTDLKIPAVLDELLVARLQKAAVAVFTRLKCKGMARVDFFVNESTKKIYFSEINTLPGFTSISMYPKLMVAAGFSYENLLNKLIQAAIKNHKKNQLLVKHYQ